MTKLATADLREFYRVHRPDGSPERPFTRRFAEEAGREFDAWLVEHDDEVRVKYEENRNAVPIHIDNIDGELAKVWLGRYGADLLAGFGEAGIPPVVTPKFKRDDVVRINHMSGSYEEGELFVVTEVKTPDKSHVEGGSFYYLGDRKGWGVWEKFLDLVGHLDRTIEGD